MANRKKVTPKVEKQIFNLRDSGVKLKDIATELDISLATVKRTLYNGNTVDLEARKAKKERSKQLVEEVQAMLKQGIKGTEIAEQLGITSATVSQIKNGKRNWIRKKDVKTKLDNDKTLKSRLKGLGLNRQDLSISKAKYYGNITYVYWKGIRINTFPSGITRSELLNETGNYTLNMILDVEKSLNKKEK